MKLEHFSLSHFTNLSIFKLVESEISNGLTCEKIAFPKSEIFNYHAYQFSKVNSAGRVVYGLGVDFNEKKAIVKGFVEFHERNAFLDIGITKGLYSTNGIAGHRFYSLARNAAMAELIERDALLMHWYSKTPFMRLKPLKEFERFRASLSNDGFDLLFVETTLGFSRATICFLINKATLGFVIGLSSRKSELEDMHKALSEALVNLHFGSYGKSVEEQQSDLVNNGLDSLTNHRCYWLYNKTLPAWVFNSTDSVNKLNNDLEIKVTDVFHARHELVHLVGVTSENTLPLEIGYPSAASVGLLNKKLNLKLKQEEIEPHPLP